MFALRPAAVLACLLALGALALAQADQARALPSRAPQLDAGAAALIDAGTGQLLYAGNATAELPIASTTKLMTALVTLEHARLSAVFTEPQYYPAAVDSQIGLVPGERMSVHDLLLALLLPSADDAAEDLAYNVGSGSVGRFVAMMNARARQLGLTQTHYSTPIGLDTPGNYSSARDLVRLARYVMAAKPFFRAAVALPRARIHRGAEPLVIENRNDLVGAVPWINGVKTGHTLQAGYVLVGSGTQNGMTLISAVLRTPSEAERDASTLTLLRYGFAAFREVTPVRQGMAIGQPSISDRPGRRATVIATATFTRTVARGERLRTRAVFPRQLAGPLARGTRVGTVLVVARGRVIGRVALVLAAAVPAPPPALALAPLWGPITLVFVLILGLAAVYVGGYARRRSRGRAVQGGRR